MEPGQVETIPQQQPMVEWSRYGPSKRVFPEGSILMMQSRHGNAGASPGGIEITTSIHKTYQQLPSQTKSIPAAPKIQLILQRQVPFYLTLSSPRGAQQPSQRQQRRYQHTQSVMRRKLPWAHCLQPFKPRNSSKSQRQTKNTAVDSRKRGTPLR